MDRFRVKTSKQTWKDKGPDLLRTRTNVRSRIATDLEVKFQGKFVTRRKTAEGFTKWSDPTTKHVALQTFDAWAT